VDIAVASMNRRPDFVQPKAFDLRVAKVYADANHFSDLPQ
jgi:hypothetical protein